MSRAFIQCNRVKDIVTGTYILTPISPSVFDAYYGLREMGYVCVMFETQKDLEEYYHAKSEIICGGVGIIRSRLKEKFGISCEEINYPEELRPYLKRDIWESTINTVRDHPETWPVFVKSIEGKRLTGKVIAGISDLVGCGCCDEDYPVLCSRPLQFVSEWRVFVRYGKILDVKLYKGDWKQHYNPEVIEKCISDYTSAPNAYGIDFAVTDTGDTVLVEVNDAWALGSYGLPYWKYAKLLITRWAELTGTHDKYYYICG